MQSKFGLVALSAMATLVLFGGNTAQAKSEETDKKDEKVIVKVKEGDTLTAIAEKHDTTYKRIFNANKSIDNPDMIDVGQKFRIPDEDEKLKNRKLPEGIVLTPEMASNAPTVTPTPSTDAGVTVKRGTAMGSTSGNTYYWGQCTWYVKNKRPDLPNNLGNGGQWVANAAAQGLPTGSTPRVGAVAEEPGHVAYVEAVKGSMITITEMNYNGGVGKVHQRDVPASNYRYIY